MATVLARLTGHTTDTTAESISGIDLLTPEEARALFDRRARQLPHISGAEFLRGWNAGAYRPAPDDAEGRKVGELVMMMPISHRTKP